jgi:hypothetical protein
MLPGAVLIVKKLVRVVKTEKLYLAPQNVNNQTNSKMNIITTNSVVPIKPDTQGNIVTKPEPAGIVPGKPPRLD